jgi:hypothetical protein
MARDEVIRSTLVCIAASLKSATGVSDPPRMKRGFRATTVLLCGKHRGRFSPWCSEARSLVGPGTLEHPRLCHGRYRRPGARLSDFLSRGSTLAA